MLKFHPLTLLWILLSLACGRIPTRYDTLVLNCGEIDRELLASAGGLIQVVDGDQFIQGSEIEAQWLKPNSAPLSLKVSSRACIVTPQSEGTLSIVSKDQQRGLFLKQPKGDLREAKKVSLIAAKELDFSIGCQQATVRDLSQIGLSIQWARQDRDMTEQITSMQLSLQKQQNQTPVLKIPLADQNWLSNAPLQIPSFPLDDGSYILRLEVSSIVQTIKVSDASCPFEYDATAPQTNNILPLQLFNSGSPLVLKKPLGTEKIYYCIGSIDISSCQDTNQFLAASEFLFAPLSGSQVLYSFQTDAAGNRSAIVKEDFYLDQSSPTVRIDWLAPFADFDSLWAVALGKKYSFKATVADDSVSAGYYSQDQLEENLECKLSLVLPTGGELPAAAAVCTAGECAGRSLGAWAPCSGLTEFQINDEWLYLKSKVKLIARVSDHFAKQGITHSSFWLNPDAMGKWVSDVSFPSKFLDRNLYFANDKFSRLVAFSPFSSVSAYPDSKNELFIKLQSSRTWSGPISTETDEERTLRAFSDRRILITQSPGQDINRQSLWLGESAAWTFAEVQFDKDIPEKLSVNIHRIPETIREKIPQSPDVALMIESAPLEYYLVLRNLRGASPGAYALIRFTGTDYSLLVQSDESLLHGDLVGLIHGPDRQALLVFENTLAVFDPQSKKLTFLKMEGDLQSKIQFVYSDAQGIYGLNEAHEIFTLDLDWSKKMAHVKVLSEPKAPTLESLRIFDFRRATDGSYWMSSIQPLKEVYSYRLGVDTEWQMQSELWGWNKTSQSEAEFTLGIDRQNQVFVATQMGVRRTVACDFIEVTEQGGFQAGLNSEVGADWLKAVGLTQDGEGQIWRTQYIRDSKLILFKWNDKSMDETEIQPLAFERDMQLSSIILEDRGQLYLSDHEGRHYKLDQKTGSLSFAFSIDNPRLEQGAFDAFGNLWGVQNSQLLVRRSDGETRTFNFGLGAVRKFQLWDKKRAWVIFNESSGESIYEVDLATQKFTEAAKFSNKLIEMKTKMDDQILFGQKLLAAVRIPVANNINRSELKLLVDNGQGQWLESSSLPQPQWPDWHPDSGNYITADVNSSFKLFHNSQSGDLWLGGQDFLAKFSRGSWHVYNLSQTHLKGQIKNFWLDSKGQMLISTPVRIFLYNNHCSNSIGPHQRPAMERVR